MTKRKTEVNDIKFLIETLEIQILECTFCVSGLNYGEPNPSHNVNAFIKTLTEYLFSLPEEEREEYFEIIQPGRFRITEITTVTPSRTGISSHKGLELNFKLTRDEKDSIVYVPEWKSKTIRLIKNMIEEKAMTNIIGSPLVYITSKEGHQILYK